MSLSALDMALIEHKGSAQETLKELLNWNLGANNADKYRSAIRRYLRHKEDIDTSRQIGDMEKTVIREDGTTTTTRMLLLSEEDSKNPKRIMELMGFDVLQWELLSCEIERAYWDVSMRLRQGQDEEGKNLPDLPVKKTNHAYKCRVRVRPIQQIISSDMIRELFETLPAPNLYIYHGTNHANKMIEFPIMDLHLGKLAWDDETGENWDLKIAEQTFRKIISEGLERLKTYNIKPERIIFPIGQDFFHFDTPRSTTANGTIVDSDTRWQKMFAKGAELLVWAIENLRREAPVECMYISGNHDKMLSYCLVYTLNAYFRNCDNVTVDVSPMVRKYIDYGINLIGYSHGSEEGKRIETLMQAEVPELWGKSKFREWHLGHLHHENVQEDGGVIVRRLSSVTSTDSWHKEKGYVGAVRKAQIFVWDKLTGKDMTIDINVDVRA